MLARWWPMKPQPPVTRTRFPAMTDRSLPHPMSGSCWEEKYAVAAELFSGEQFHLWTRTELQAVLSLQRPDGFLRI
jgi:hypothetical protein